jgi:cyanate permease
VGAIHDATGGYTVPFTITALLTYASAIAVLFARPAKHAAVPADAVVENLAATGGR